MRLRNWPAIGTCTSWLEVMVLASRCAEEAMSSCGYVTWPHGGAGADEVYLSSWSCQQDGSKRAWLMKRQ